MLVWICKLWWVQTEQGIKEKLSKLKWDCRWVHVVHVLVKGRDCGVPAGWPRPRRKWGRSSSVGLNRYLSAQRWRKWVLSDLWTASSLQAGRTEKTKNSKMTSHRNPQNHISLTVTFGYFWFFLNKFSGYDTHWDFLLVNQSNLQITVKYCSRS